MVEFGDFRLGQFLLRAGVIVPVTPKSLTLLRTLVASAGHLVDKEQLWAAAWQGRVVTDAAMTVCIAELRKALGDKCANPSYIETVHKRGYRFVAALRTLPAVTGSCLPSRPVTQGSLTGREAQLAILHAERCRAAVGERRIALISAGAGMGKTTLVRAFATALAACGDCRVVIGHCVEQHADGDAYLPLLEMLQQLHQDGRDADFGALLETRAPAWVGHLPGAAHTAPTAGVSRERMMLELVLLFEAAASSRTLVLVFEDLHWADPSTLAWLDFVCRRFTSCRLLLVATCRDGPAPQPARLHRLLGNLATLGCLRAVALGPLDRAAVASYVRTRTGVDQDGYLLPRRPDDPMVDACPAMDFVAEAVHRWTGGVPLFVARAVNHLNSRRPRWKDSASLFGPALGADLVAELGPLIQAQLAPLAPAAVELLELASICGTSFDVATLASVQGRPADDVDAVCAALALANGLVARAGSTVLPNGCVTSRYAFTHECYRQALYERQPSGRRLDLHRAVALAERRLWRDRLHAVAMRVARHFELGQLYVEAAELCLCAGQAALRKAANEEACSLLQRGLTLLALADCEDSIEHSPLEIALRLMLGPVTAALRGSVHFDARRNYLRARMLARRVADAAGCFDAEFGLRGLALARGALRVAHRHGVRLLDAARQADDPELELEARLACANTSFQMGRLVSGNGDLERALALYQPARDRSHSSRFGMDPAMFCLALSGITSALRGDAASANAAISRALAGENVCSHPYSLVTAHNFAAWNAQLLTALPTVMRHAAIAAELAERHGFTTGLALARVRLGWARAQTGAVAQGIAEITDGIASWQRTGAALGLPYFHVLLAESHLLGGAIAPAAAALDRASHIIERTGERWIEAEVWRLRAICVVDLASAARCHLERATTVAGNQGAVLFEQRAAGALKTLRGDGRVQHA